MDEMPKSSDGLYVEVRNDSLRFHHSQTIIYDESCFLELETLDLPPQYHYGPHNS